MDDAEQATIYTIGHSTHDVDAFMGMLQSFQVQCLVDIRRFPGSRKFPHYNEPALRSVLTRRGIQYRHMEALGGRRKVRPDSPNTNWRNASFRGYADYMETDEFQQAARQLEALGQDYVTAYMCAEAVWWRCHRSLVSDYLKAKGWTVRHIMAAGRSTLHPYTKPARITNGRLSYASGSLFDGRADV